MRTRKKKLVDPLQFEMSIQAEDLSGYVPAFGWEMAPPSDKQKQELEKRGILPDEIDNAGKANLILDRLHKRQDGRPYHTETDPVPGKIWFPACRNMDV